MDLETFEKEIEKYFHKMNLKISKEQKEKLYNFMKILIERNKQFNLTAITAEKEVILKHFIDSIIIEKYIKAEDSVIDIGTGAGFPGIPLKIIKEENKFILLDSLNKRVNFIEEIIQMLELKNINAIHSRAEDAGQNEKYRESFDIATSRAVSRMNVLIEYMLPFVKVGGKCICLKGPNIEEELNESKKAIEMLGGKIEEAKEIILPESDLARSIVIIKKIKETPKKYPRKAGMPNNKPL